MTLFKIICWRIFCFIGLIVTSPLWIFVGIFVAVCALFGMLDIDEYQSADFSKDVKDDIDLTDEEKEFLGM